MKPLVIKRMTPSPLFVVTAIMLGMFWPCYLAIIPQQLGAAVFNPNITRQSVSIGPWMTDSQGYKKRTVTEKTLFYTVHGYHGLAPNGHLLPDAGPYNTKLNKINVTIAVVTSYVLLGMLYMLLLWVIPGVRARRRRGFSVIQSGT
jgi:hypothetical protein